MTVSQFNSIFDYTKNCFVAVIDSSKKIPADALIEQSPKCESVASMYIDRIAFFTQPEFVLQWSDCMEDFQCSRQCENVIVIFAHKENELPLNTKLKSEEFENVDEYCQKLNANHHH